MATAKTNELISYIAEIAGEQVAHKVWKEFSGSQPYIPKYPKSDQKQLYVLKALERGENVRQIAKALDVSDRQIYTRLGRPVRPVQIALF
jgi:DNA-binding NarL/FixJ family response regulator